MFRMAVSVCCLFKKVLLFAGRGSHLCAMTVQGPEHYSYLVVVKCAALVGVVRLSGQKISTYTWFVRLARVFSKGNQVRNLPRLLVHQEFYWHLLMAIRVLRLLPKMTVGEKMREPPATVTDRIYHYLRNRPIRCLKLSRIRRRPLVWAGPGFEPGQVGSDTFEGLYLSVGDGFLPLLDPVRWRARAIACVEKAD